VVRGRPATKWGTNVGSTIVGSTATVRGVGWRRRGDAGSGIDADLLGRLGEPFLTTKATVTGLGLAVVMAVVRAHHGKLQLRSRVGRGTCVRVELPLIVGQPAEVA
jgi:signal transduction histidine kinase